MGKLIFCLATFFVSTVSPSLALAYIGPGAGLGAIGTFLAVVGAALLLIVGFVWYPVKRLLRWLKARKDADKKETADRRS